MKRSLNILILFLAFFILFFFHKHNDPYTQPQQFVPKHIINYNSIVYIRNINLIEQSMGMGSGVILSSSPEESLVLSAAHVCFPDNTPSTFWKHTFIYIDVTTHYGVDYITSIKAIDFINDICILSIKDNLHNDVKISLVEPLIGDEVWTSGYPLGVWSNQFAPTFHGFYAGNMENDAVYTIPTTNGMSGSPVFNTNGEMISIISRTTGEFPEIALGPRLYALKLLIEECVKKGGKDFQCLPPTTINQQP